MKARALLNELKGCYWRWRLRKHPVPDGFDEAWYRGQYRDLCEAGVDPKVHYLRFGRREGRDPNPDFSSSGYRFVCPQASGAEDLLAHYHDEGREAGCSPRPELYGAQLFRPGQPSLLVCGHQAGTQLYGAERSLLDVLEGFNTLNVNLVVTLPSALNPDYVARVQALAWRVVILPYGWWRKDKALVAATQKHFEQLLQTYQADALYANTLVLDEPLLAARTQGLPVVVHIRELPAHDPDLCTILGAGPEEISARLQSLADLCVTNSAYTARSLGLENATVVPNSIDGVSFTGLTTPAQRGEPVTVGMISSNIPKKGLDDFVALAPMLKSLAPEARCRLIGPETEAIRALKVRQAKGQLPDNLELADYAPSPQEALAQLDILVNLSHFQESFGRTALEAMAAGRPVVAYEWGALPELVVHGETGYLAPLGAVETIAGFIEVLLRDDALRQRMGEAGQRRADQRFGPEPARAALHKILQKVNQKATQSSS